MGRLRIKSSDILKWGFLGQIGRSAGRDFYKGAKNLAKTYSDTYIDTSSVDMSKIGELDDTGHFVYNRFEYTTRFEYVLYLIAIIILPIIFAPIMLVKAFRRLFRRKVHFVNIYNCPTYKKNGGYLIGYTPMEFKYVKSYSDAAQGIQINGSKNDAVKKAKSEIVFYFLLAFIGFSWMYQVHSFFSSIIHQDDVVKNQRHKSLLIGLTQ